MKKTILFILLILWSIMGFSQEIQENLKISSQQFIDAFLSKDYQTMAEMSHPNIIKLGGGIEFLAKEYQENGNGLADMGFIYTQGLPGEIDKIYNSENEIFCFVPQIFTLDINGEKYQTSTSLLASSTDEGNTWTFINLERFDASSIKGFIPGFLDEMSWPEKQELVKINQKPARN